MAYTPKQSLIPHSTFPHLPAQAIQIEHSTGCEACPLKQAAGHKTCGGPFKVKGPVPNEARIDLDQLRSFQFAIEERQRVVEGVVGASGDAFYPYNSKDAFNFVYWSTWNVDSVSGDTITLSTPDASNPREILEGTWRDKDPEYGFFWVNGFASYCAVSPGMMFQLDYPSSLYRLTYRIEKVLQTTATTIKLQLDKSIANGMNTISIEDEEATQYTGKVFTYGRSGRKWQYVINPHYFYGVQKIVEVEASELEADGIYTLESSAIATPNGSFLSDLDPVFYVEGFGNEGYEPINDHTRLHVNPTSSKYCLKDTKPAGSIITATFTDLTATYSKFRFSYYIKTANTNSGDCRLIQYDRCYYSREDKSGSVSAAYVGATGTSGNHYCSERIYEKYIPIDDYNRIEQAPVGDGVTGDGIPDRVEIEQLQPTAIGSYVPACVQYGYCDKYTSSHSMMGDAQAPYSTNYTLGTVLNQLWFNADWRLHQRYVLANGFGGYEIQRVGTPSIMYQLGYYGGLVTPAGWHTKDTFPYENTYGFPITVTADDGNESITFVSGFERGYSYGDYEDVSGNWENTNVERLSFLNTNVSGYTTTRDPFNFDATTTTNLLPQIGCLIKKDEGTLEDIRGISKSSVSIKPQDVIIPNVELDNTDLQQREQGDFQKDTGGEITLTIHPLRQALKPETVLGSRTISDTPVVDLGSGRYQVEFENETVTFSRFSIGDPNTIGDSYDQIFSVEAGGIFPIQPYENQVVNSYESRKTIGAKNAGARALDALRFEDADGFCVLIESVTPHGGSEAPTWGNKQIVVSAQLDGAFTASPSTSVDPITGENVSNTPLEILSVIRQSDSTIYTVLTDEEKPDLAALEVWYDEDKKIYFSSADHNLGFTIVFNDSDEDNTSNPYTQYFTVQQYVDVDTYAEYSEWTSATTKTVYLGETVATVLSSGDPAKDQVVISDNGGKIRVRYNIDNSPAEVRIVLVTNIEAPAPQNDWSHDGKYLSYGKKRDIAIVRDTTGYFDSPRVGDTVEFVASSSVFLTDVYQVEWTLQAEDNWQLIPEVTTAHFNGATGKITIPDSFITNNELTNENVCFRVKALRYIDHRGSLGAELWNRTQNFIQAPIWVKTSTGAGFGDFTIEEFVDKHFASGNLMYNLEAEDCITDDEDGEFRHVSGNVFGGNHLYADSTDDLSQAELKVSASSFGAFQVLNNLPDGCTINACIAEISGGGLTRSYTYQEAGSYDCDGNELIPPVNPDSIPDTSISDIAFDVIAFTGPNEFDIIGTIPGAGDNTQIKDITPIAEYMYANRHNPSIIGYGIIYSPLGYGDGEGIGLEKYISKAGQRAEEVCIDGLCYSKGDTAMSWYTYRYLNIEWDNLSIGNVAINISYPEGYIESGFVQPPLPSMKELAA